MSVYQAVQDGEYKNKLEYPATVREPAVLRKVARDLTADEAKSLPAVCAQYAADKEAYVAARQAYNEETAALTSKLKADLEAEHGLVGHPKADKVWAKAWEDGHSSGYGEVASIYDDLAELVL